MTGSSKDNKQEIFKCIRNERNPTGDLDLSQMDIIKLLMMRLNEYFCGIFGKAG